jgi:hypothetical protein
MSRTLHICTYYGREVPRSVFFTPTNDLKRVCSYAPDTHLVSDTARFCEQCGAPTAGQSIEIPTEAFRAFCAAQDIDPAYAFHQLNDTGWHWTTKDEQHEVHIGWFAVQSYNTTNTRSNDQVMALGVEINNIRVGDGALTTIAYKLSDPSLGINKYQIPVVAEALRAFSDELKLPVIEPQFYVQLYVSN